MIKKYDIYLAAYIANHISVLENIKNKFNYIEKNWNNFLIGLEMRQYNLIWDICMDCLCKGYDSEYSPSEFIYYVGEELGIKEKLEKYDFIKRLEESYDYSLYDKEENLEVIVIPESKHKINKEEFKFTDLVLYNKIRQFMIEILSSKEPEKLEIFKEKDEYIESTKKKPKIIKFQ